MEGSLLEVRTATTSGTPAKWLLWYNGRHGGLEQIGVVLHAGEDLGFL
jgi:hypothetical protein